MPPVKASRLALVVLAAAATAGADEPAAPSTEPAKSPAPAKADPLPPRFRPENYGVVDLEHVRYTMYPRMSIGSAPDPSLANLHGDLHELDAQLLYPAVLRSGDTTLLAGFNYTYTHYALSGLTDLVSKTNSGDVVRLQPVPSDLHALVLVFGLVQRLAAKWTLVLQLKPGVFGDFRTFDQGAISLQGIGLFTYRPSARFSVGLGFAYQSKFGTPLAVPLLELNAYLGAGFRLYLLLPDNAQLLFTPHHRLVLSLFGRVGGGLYRIHPDATLTTTASNGQTSTAPVSYYYDLSYSTISAGIGVRVRLVDGLYLAVEVPVAIHRTWDANQLCLRIGGQRQCNDGPISTDMANLPGSLSLGGTVALEYHY